jgi:hypothetical protein
MYVYTYVLYIYIYIYIGTVPNKQAATRDSSAPSTPAVAHTDHHGRLFAFQVRKKNTNPSAPSIQIVIAGALPYRYKHTCFASTKLQILTPEELSSAIYIELYYVFASVWGHQVRILVELQCLN